MSLLDELVAAAHRRARALHSALHSALHEGATPRPAAGFATALRGRDAPGGAALRVIAEFKRQSPSRGALAPRADLGQQVRRYAAAGASAISILTEPERFGGSLDDLRQAAMATTLPVLMKDFVVEPVQIEAGAACGASAVLLIARCLDTGQLDELVAACTAHQIAALIECHDEAEVERALGHEHAVVGANNRDLDTLRIDSTLAPALLRNVPLGRIAVAESGYQDTATARALRGTADAVLIGSALMTSDDPAAFLREVIA